MVLEAPPAPLPFWGDEDQLRQLLLNLGLNALKAMEEGGTLTLELQEAPEELRFAVEDTGKGIPEDLVDRVFEPFVTTRPDGTGLGLSIAQRIAQDHGGNLSCRTWRCETRSVLSRAREEVSDVAGAGH